MADNSHNFLLSCPSNTSEAGTSPMCEGCPGQMFCRSSVSKDDPNIEKMRVRMAAIKHKILIVAGKGGVGKSSIASAIAIKLVKRGNSVGLLDVDICGPSIPRLLNLQGEQVQNSPYGWVCPCPEWSNKKLKVISAGFLTATRDSPIVWRGPRKTSLIKRFLTDTFWGKLDYLIIDTPPGTSDEHLSVVTSLLQSNPDGAIIVTTPQDISSITVRKEISFCKKMKLPILGIVENMSGFICPCCNELTNIYEGNGGSKLVEELNLSLLGKIPMDANISICGDTGKDIEKESISSKYIDEMITNLENIL